MIQRTVPGLGKVRRPPAAPSIMQLFPMERPRVASTYVHPPMGDPDASRKGFRPCPQRAVWASASLAQQEAGWLGCPLRTEVVAGVGRCRSVRPPIRLLRRPLLPRPAVGVEAATTLLRPPDGQALAQEFLARRALVRQSVGFPPLGPPYSATFKKAKTARHAMPRANKPSAQEPNDTVFWFQPSTALCSSSAASPK